MWSQLVIKLLLHLSYLICKMEDKNRAYETHEDKRIHM